MLIDVPPKFIRSAVTDEAETVAGAGHLLAELSAILDRPDLGGVDLLDVGCGIKFSQAILNGDLPLGSYTGVDIYADLIEFLSSEVTDERFTYRHLDAANDLYNPDGQPFTTTSDLGIGDARFDAICLYSVFTHLNPTDYVTMLEHVRRHIRPNGRLVYTAFLDEPTKGGHSLVDFLGRTFLEMERRDGRLLGTVEEEWAKQDRVPFVDVDPTRPLTWAMYSREHAIELVEGTGWRIDAIRPPVALRQHLFVCSPV